MRHIVHMDLDAFFVSVERLKHPELCGIPLVVGGSSHRGIVAAASYEARKFGIHSAMPMKMAYRLCPNIKVISGDMEDYSKYSQLVTDIISSRVPLYEKSSIDEFYIDLTGMDRHFGCVKYSKELKEYIFRESGLSISYALATNKLVSKVATNEVKPNGTEYVPSGLEKAYLSPLSIQKMPMIGSATTQLLQRMGVYTIKVLSEIPMPMLHNLMGKNGVELWQRANGIDDSPVIPYREQKSVSAERTFQSDMTDVKWMEAQLIELTEKVTFELRSQQKLCACITVKIRYADFDTQTRQLNISLTAQDHILILYAKEIFAKLYDRRQRIRLIGIKLSKLTPGSYQASLFDDTEESISLYTAIDSIKEKFGSHILSHAVTKLTVKNEEQQL